MNQDTIASTDNDKRILDINAALTMLCESG